MVSHMYHAGSAGNVEVNTAARSSLERLTGDAARGDEQAWTALAHRSVVAPPRVTMRRSTSGARPQASR